MIFYKFCDRLRTKKMKIKKKYRWKLFLSTPKVFFLNKLINLKFQKIITFLQKIFFDGTFHILLLKRWQIIKKNKKDLSMETFFYRPPKFFF